MNQILGIAVAVIGLLTGLAWKFKWGRSGDLTYFHKINKMQLSQAVDRFLIFVRPLGTNWFLLLVLALAFIWRYEIAGSLTIAAILTAAVESGIKVIIKRPRPFMDHENTIIRQNPLPRDPSFPSGDATRIWFILAATIFGFHLSPIWIVLMGIFALVINFGRVRLGVHYPLDVWAGSSLGFGLGLAWTGFIL
jgi:undecaprenyl-diphosphatase